ncbi:MAG: ABC transporter ATP-binding protein/permease [Defluviitaleaceae bacterium]|nr:ABC transporter ATP-binding protein/permease [Defluviitaleaceae bacterium]
MFAKLKYRATMLKAFRPFSFGVNRFMVLNGVVSVTIMGLSFVQPLFYGLFIDEVILGGQFSLMFIVIIGYFGIFLLKSVFAYVKNYSTNRWVNRVTYRVKMKIIRGVFKRDFLDYDNQSVGDMKMRVEDDTSCIADYAEAQTTGYVTAFLTLVISTVLLLFIEWRLAIFAIIGIPLTLWLDNSIAKREAKVLDWQRENAQKMSSWLHSSVQGWREIKALNLQKHEEKKFIQHIRKFAVYFGTWINYWVARAIIIPKIKEEFLMRFGLYFFGGMLIIGGYFSIGSLLIFMQYYALLSGALETVSRTDAELISAKPKSERMLEELFASSRKQMEYKIPSGDGGIEFRDVSFSYPSSDKAVVNNLSFYISKGERVAIVGKSGAGKTTILKLILGMLQPTYGEVIFSGVSTKKIKTETLHRHFGFAMQENTLFNASIKENLLYAKPNATDDELRFACEKAFILDFIDGLDNGLDTVIGERGVKLSGGQRQRITLAKQFLRDVDVYVFDEATSALDQYSENIIQDAIESIAKDKTIIVVAHRKSSISLCDKVIEV